MISQYFKKVALKIVLLNLSLFLILGLILAACERQTDQKNRRFVSSEIIDDFLIKEYFEIPEDKEAVTDFPYRLISGGEEEYRGNLGKVVFLNFWATWCVPCKIEMPDMEALHNLMKGEDFRILAVNVGEDANKVKRYVDQFQYTFDIIIDEDMKTTSRFRVSGLPTTIILDKKGRMLGRIMGPKNWNKPAFQAFFKDISRI